ncbi:MAG: hypothetical protein RLZZ450_6515 [Pseudomonadota bacterium]
MGPKLSILLTLLLSSSFVAGARAESRIAVHDFYGPEAAELRDRVAALLTNQEGVTVAAKSEIDRLATELHTDPFTPEGRRLISRPAQLSAWLTGVVEIERRRVRLTIIVYDGADHTRMGRVVIKARSVRKLKAQLKTRLWEELRAPILASLSPLPPGRAPIETTASDVSAVASSEPHVTTKAVEGVRSAPTHAAYMEPAEGLTVSRFGGGQRDDSAAEARKRGQHKDPLRVSLGFGSPRRSLRYSDPLSSGLNDYQLGGSLLLDAAVAYYPAQHFTIAWPSYFGLDLAAQGALGASSKDSFGNRYDSHYDAYRVGVRGRVPVGAHFVSAFVGYTLLRGSVSAEPSETTVKTPGVDYRALRSGVGTELKVVDGMTVAADVAWLNMLSVGELGTWFPRATASGFELAVQANYALTEHFFARVAGSYRRAVFDFHAQPGDQRVAGGATDDVLTLSAGAGVSL